MKTQISNLRSGTKNQVLNSQVNYNELPKATSHIGHSGSNQVEVDAVWAKVIEENPTEIKAIIKGIEVVLTAKWSLSGKSVGYTSAISAEDLESKFNLVAAKGKTATISINGATSIVVSNGKNSYVHVCPSFIEII
jgi:hypothetical protein